MFTHDQKIQWLTISYNVARNSPDLSTQNGAIIINNLGQVVGMGCNEFPRGVKVLQERLVSRPEKYLYVEHAERNAIYNSIYMGQTTVGATMFCPWFACADCARGIIQSGIKKVIGHQKMFDDTPERWRESIDNAFVMFDEAGVETELIVHDFGLEPRRFNEQMWTP
jgi:dCMP deaminase